MCFFLQLFNVLLRHRDRRHRHPAQASRVRLIISLCLTFSLALQGQPFGISRNNKIILTLLKKHLLARLTSSHSCKVPVRACTESPGTMPRTLPYHSRRSREPCCHCGGSVANEKTAEQLVAKVAESCSHPQCHALRVRPAGGNGRIRSMWEE